MRPCYLFDLDGTLADCTHRLHHIEKAPKDWRAFFAAVKDDKPIPHVVTLLRDLLDGGCNIVLMSGRSDECRDATTAWIDGVVVVDPMIELPLYMRAAGDRRPDNVVKRELLARLRADGWEPIMAFDDRDQVVAMWRAEGVPCAQVAPGTF